MVAEELKKRSTAEWVEAFERADIPVQRMNSLDDIVADPHLAAIGYFSVREHPTRRPHQHARGAFRVVRIRSPNTGATRRAWASTRARCSASSAIRRTRWTSCLRAAPRVRPIDTRERLRVTSRGL